MRKQFAYVAILTLMMSVGLSTLCEREAMAKRRFPLPFLINYGSTIYPVAPIPDEIASRANIPDISEWELGYKCRHIGIFYADVVCWEKELVLFKEDTYSDIPDDLKKELAAEYPFSEAERSTWNQYGIVISISIILSFLIISGVSQKLLERDERKERRLVNDAQDAGPQYGHTDVGPAPVDDTTCPKCGSNRRPSEIECSKCGIIYEKYMKYLALKAHA